MDMRKIEFNIGIKRCLHQQIWVEDLQSPSRLMPVQRPERKRERREASEINFRVILRAGEGGNFLDVFQVGFKR